MCFPYAPEHDAPRYEPARAVPHETLREYGGLGEWIGVAEDRWIRDEGDRLTWERSALVAFFPIVEHTFGENADEGSFTFR